MSAGDPKETLNKAAELLGCFLSGEGALSCVKDAKSLLEELVLDLPPIAPTQLDPTARADADAEAKADEDEKFGKEGA